MCLLCLTQFVLNRIIENISNHPDDRNIPITLSFTPLFRVYQPYFTRVHSRLTRWENLMRIWDKGKNLGLKVKILLNSSECAAKGSSKARKRKKLIVTHWETGLDLCIQHVHCWTNQPRAAWPLVIVFFLMLLTTRWKHEVKLRQFFRNCVLLREIFQYSHNKYSPKGPTSTHSTLKLCFCPSKIIFNI